MYIDIHAHIGYGKIYPQAYMAGMLGGLKNADASKVNSLVNLLLQDKSCSNFLKQMDQAGIDKAVLLIIDGGIGLGEAALTLEEIFTLHHQVLQAHPDRFIVFGGVDPRRGPAGFELFSKGIHEYGFRGMKLYPPMGYAIDDERLLPYFDLCGRHKLPVLIHSGPSLPVLHNDFAQPERYIKTLTQHEHINFVLAHLGYRLHDPVVQTLAGMSNVFLDITGFQTLDHTDQQVKQMLQQIFNPAVSGKILYGSDWPLFNVMKPIKNHIDILAATHAESGFSNQSFNQIMYQNAQSILATF